MGSRGGLHGVICLWLEPLTERLLNFWRECLALRRPGKTALVYRSQGAFELGQRWFDEDIPVALQLGHYRTEEWSVWVEQLQPPPQLVVCGAGPDAVPLVRGALGLGWDVQLIDHRPPFLDNPEFAGAEVAGALAAVVQDSAVVVMSHNLERDRGYLSQALQSRPATSACSVPANVLAVYWPVAATSAFTAPSASTSARKLPKKSLWPSWPKLWPSQSNRQAGFLSHREAIRRHHPQRNESD